MCSKSAKHFDAVIFISSADSFKVHLGISPLVAAGGIAKKYYGSAGKYMKIFEANRDIISDPNKIYPGQKIKIPLD